MEHRDPTLSRRDFLTRLAALGALGLGSSAILAACGGDSGPAADGDAPAADGSGVVAAECEGYAELTEEERELRETLQYVDDAPANDECRGCRYYLQPEGSSPCGGCEIFAGPVAPGGHCTSYTSA